MRNYSHAVLEVRNLGYVRVSARHVPSVRAQRRTFAFPPVVADIPLSDDLSLHALPLLSHFPLILYSSFPFFAFFLWVCMYVCIRVCLLCAVHEEAKDSLGPQLSTLVLRSRSLVGWNFLIRLGFLLSDPLGACPCLFIVGIAGTCCCTRVFIHSRVFIFMWQTFFQLCHLPSPCGYIFFFHLDPKVCLM